MKRIHDIIRYENESSTVDFKKTEYPLGQNPKKYDILKDFSAFANNLSDEDKYIVVGVKEKEDKSKEFYNIETPTDDAKYQQFINENIEPAINFEYRCIEYNGKKICFFRLFNNTNRPYMIKRDLPNNIKKGDGYIRKGTSNSKIGREELDQIIDGRLKYVNRRDDIRIKPIIGKYENEYSFNLYFLDVDIENISNQSIEINIEIKFERFPDYTITEEFDFLNTMNEEKRKMEREKERNSNFHYRSLFNTPPLPRFKSSIEFEEDDNCLSFKTVNSIKLLQNNSESKIFEKTIILIESNVDIIEAEVIIRSDDFKEGALKKKIKFLLSEEIKFDS